LLNERYNISNSESFVIERKITQFRVSLSAKLTLETTAVKKARIRLQVVYNLNCVDGVLSLVFKKVLEL
jgi:hypothetical protein